MTKIESSTIILFKLNSVFTIDLTICFNYIFLYLKELLKEFLINWNFIRYLKFYTHTRARARANVITFVSYENWRNHYFKKGHFTVLTYYVTCNFYENKNVRTLYV